MDYRTTCDDPFKVAKAVMAIGSARNLLELNAVGIRIGKSTFTADDTVTLRHLFREHRRTLTNSPS